MSDETKIEPALSAAEWDEQRIDDDGSALRIEDGRLVNEAWGQPVDRPAAVIALANAALPDNDPRKITRGWPDLLRVVANGLAVRIKATTPESYHDALFAHVNAVLEIADALASYLPPVGPPPLRVERGGLPELPPDLEQKLRNSL